MAGVWDDDVRTVLESLSHFVSLERLRIVVELAADEKRRNTCADRRTKSIAEIEVFGNARDVERREVHHVTKYRCSGFAFDLLSTLCGGARRTVHHHGHHGCTGAELVVSSFREPCEDRIISAVHCHEPRGKDRQIVRIPEIHPY